MRLIDADALVKELSGKYIVPVDEATRGVAAFMGIQMRQAINNAPTIEAVPLEDYRSMEQTVYKLTQALAEAEPVKHGHWIRRLDTRFGRLLNDIIICSNCNIAFSSEQQIRRSYCPNCGAKMDEPEAEP